MVRFPSAWRAASRVVSRGLILTVVYVVASLLGQAHATTDDAASSVAVLGTRIERPATAASVTSTTTTTPGTTSAAIPTAAIPTAVPDRPAALPDGTPPAPTTLRDRVLARISFPWRERLPGWRIEFLPARPGFRGSTFPKRKVIEIYQREGLTLEDYVHVTAHELGHAVDVTLLDDGDRARFVEARGGDGGGDWWVASGADDFSSGAGDWAECFAWWQQPSGRFYSDLGPAPGPRQLALVAELAA